MNKYLEDSECGFVQFKDGDNKWDVAKDVVDYPVSILPAYFKHDTTGDFVEAIGLTNTGREKQYCLVIVDKNRDGDLQPISTVSGNYGTLASKDVYEQLQTELAVLEESNDIKSLFITENGGSQQLTIKMNGMMSMDGIPDSLNMLIRLNTSLDGTKSHTLSMVIDTGHAEIHAYGGDYTLSARHTKTIGERSSYYIPTIKMMIDNWNDVIIPMMSLMYDCTFNRNVALELISKMCEDAKIGDAHAEGIANLYTSINLKTDATEDSMYRINMAMNQYLDDELHNSNRIKMQHKDNVTKAIQKQLNKLMT